MNLVKCLKTLILTVLNFFLSIFYLGDGYISIYEFAQKMKIGNATFLLENSSIASKEVRNLPTETTLDISIGAIINSLFFKVFFSRFFLYQFRLLENQNILKSVELNYFSN